MSNHVLTDLQPTNRVLKRAQYEAFEFSLYDGDILVRNESHADPENHEYRVSIEHGLPSACTCPADENYSGPCKHRVAVAIRQPVLDAAQQMQLLTDGGRPMSTSPSTSPTETKCDCDDLPGDFPCWECVRTGQRDMPE